MSNLEFTAKLWIYIKPYRWQVLFILLGLCVEFSYEASFRYSLKFLIDDVILKKNKEVFFLLFAIFGIAGVVYSVICVTSITAGLDTAPKYSLIFVTIFFSIYKSNLWSIITGKAVEI